MSKWQRVGDGIFAVDTDYMRPLMDASHLLIDSGRAAFIDTGTNHSAPNLAAALTAQGLEADAVEYIFLTHVHLDHAGGTGLLARMFPRARIIVHPRGAPHIIDPSKLIAGTRAVYGDAEYAALYGDILPVARERVHAVEDGERFTLGRRTFDILHTPGHALHHVCILDREAAVLFSGDTFGVSYREFDNDNGEFVIATTSPTQFDPEQLHASVNRILAAQPREIFMTHYSRVTQIERMAADLHGDIDAFVRIAKACANDPAPADRIHERLEDYVSERLARHGISGGATKLHPLLTVDVRLDADGLVSWLARAAA